ncbi:MAG: porin family protein [Deltaproteobacteria bacterium]|nr:porin family protein [Deltaproteobacteria bacterium]
MQRTEVEADHRKYSAITVAVGVLMGVLMLSSPAQAINRGWYMGLGLINQSLSGEIDGTVSLTDPAYTVEPGKLEAGGGYAFQIGYGLDPNFALELLIASSANKANHAVAGSQNATLRSGTVEMRISTGGQRLDFFTRIGWGVRSLEYANAATTTAPLQPALLTGRGGSYGVGLEHLTRKWGLEAAYNVDRVRFDHVTAGTLSGNLSPGLNASLKMFLFSINYYFR